jgi:hypothetical protein
MGNIEVGVLVGGGNVWDIWVNHDYASEANDGSV